MTNETQQKLSELIEEFEASCKYPDSPDIDSLASEINALRTFDDDINVLLLYPNGSFDYHRVHWVDDSDSPDGNALMCDFYYESEGGRMDSTGGCFYGYVSAIAAAEDNMGLMPYGKPKLYDIDGTELQEMIENFEQIDLNIVLQHIRDEQIAEYTGDYLADFDWDAFIQEHKHGSEE